MTPSLIAAANSGTTGDFATNATATLSPSGGFQAGDVVVLVWGSSQFGGAAATLTGGTPAVIDNQAGGSNTYTLVDALTGNSGSFFFGYELAYTTVSGSPSTLTITCKSSSPNKSAFSAAAWRGVTATGLQHSSLSNQTPNGTTGALASPAITDTTSGDAVVGCFVYATNQTWTAGTGATLDSDNAADNNAANAAILHLTAGSAASSNSVNAVCSEKGVALAACGTVILPATGAAAPPTLVRPVNWPQAMMRSAYR